jgi:hypothetical protein
VGLAIKAISNSELLYIIEFIFIFLIDMHIRNAFINLQFNHGYQICTYIKNFKNVLRDPLSKKLQLNGQEFVLKEQNCFLSVFYGCCSGAFRCWPVLSQH